MFDLPPTPLDLHFRVGPFPVRVSVWFFLGMAFLGSWSVFHPTLGALALGLFLLAGFVAILVHELGHAVAARSFGRPARITLVMFGGYAEYYDGQPRAGWQRLTTALAGPAAGLALALVLFVSDTSVHWSDRHAALDFFYSVSLIMNVVWSLFNLLPIWPFDGGRALREVLYLVGLRQPDVPTHTAGLVGAGFFCAVGILAFLNPTHQLLDGMPFRPGTLMTVFFGMIAYQNYQQLQVHKRFGNYGDQDDDERWRGYR